MTKLVGFSVSPQGEAEFVLKIQDDAGGTLELTASAEQLDAIIDALDDVLGDYEEEAFEIEEGETYQKPLG